MTTQDPETNSRSLHDLYCKLTGRHLKYQFYQREWSDFAKTFTADDLKAVLTWVERENSKREKRYQIRTELLRIVGDLAVFDSLKAEAELWKKERDARNRAWRPSEGEQALADMRREEVKPPEAEPRMAKELLITNLDKLKSELEKQ